jgi:hypothetical protein
VKFPNGIELSEGKEIEIAVRIRNKMPNQQHYEIGYIVPKGFNVKGPRHIAVMTNSLYTKNEEVFTLKVGVFPEADIPATSRLILEIVPIGRPTTMLVPVTLFGTIIRET